RGFPPAHRLPGGGPGRQPARHAGDSAGRPPCRRRGSGRAGALRVLAPRALGTMDEEIRSALWLSVRVSLLATLLNALVGIPLASLLAKGRFWGRHALDVLVTLPLVLPPTVTGYYLIVLFGRQGVLGSPLYELTGWTVAFTWYAAVIAATVMALPLTVHP